MEREGESPEITSGCRGKFLHSDRGGGLSKSWDPGALGRTRPSKAGPVIPELLVGFALELELGFLLQRRVDRHTCGGGSAGAARRRTGADAETVCAPRVGPVGEHAWLRGRSALHHCSSHARVEPQRPPPHALFLRACLDRSHVVSSGENLN